MAHDEATEAHIGDQVVISETRPLSAQKRFRLDKIVEKAGVTHVEAEVPEVLVVDKQEEEAEK
jgi:hypothetical protein